MTNGDTGDVGELRISLTVSDFSRLRAFYRDSVGLPETQSWDVHGHGVVFAAGRATLELIDQEHAEHVDDIEVGRRVSGPVRLALQVRDAGDVADRLVRGGGTWVGGPTQTPWGDLNARVQPPEGPQLTLFSSPPEEPTERSQPDG